jgi:FkbM family methyltransferase
MMLIDKVVRPINFGGVDSLVWPAEDNGAFVGPLGDWIHGHAGFMQFNPVRRTVIQAGGCMGMYPRFYAEYFEQVYTFEPDLRNFFFLEENCKNKKNIHYENVALGSYDGFATVKDSPDPTNRGMITVQAGTGFTKMRTIDSFNIPNVDLIHLDLEGFETEALNGALETIEKWNPVIIVERDSGGILLRSLGYKKMDQFIMDSLYVRSHRVR